VPSRCYFAPKAIAMSPTPELAVALPDCNNVAPPTEMADFEPAEPAPALTKAPHWPPRCSNDGVDGGRRRFTPGPEQNLRGTCGAQSDQIRVREVSSVDDVDGILCGFCLTHMHMCKAVHAGYHRPAADVVERLMSHVAPSLPCVSG